MAKATYNFETFNSIDEMLHAINTRPINKAWTGSSCSSVTGKAKFTGTSSFEEAVELMKGGWDEPVKDLKEAVKTLNVKSNVTTEKSRPRYGVVGYAPCVPNAIRGLPESMIATDRVPSKVKAVTIIYGTSASASTPTKDFLTAGAAVLKIINDLELRGYRVRLVNEFYSGKEGSEHCTARVVLKDWRQPIDLKKLTFPLAHSSMLRRVGFKYLETMPKLTNHDWTYGYGTSLPNVKSYEELCKLYADNGLLTDKEYYINMQMVKEERYDSEKIIKRAGMKL